VPKFLENADARWYRPRVTDSHAAGVPCFIGLLALALLSVFRAPRRGASGFAGRESKWS
jgi:hypothetical protein